MSSLRVGKDGTATAAVVRRYARQLGVRLELEQVNGEMRIVAYEIQTGVRLVDLPGMGNSRSWQSWPKCLKGLKASGRDR